MGTHTRPVFGWTQNGLGWGGGVGLTAAGVLGLAQPLEGLVRTCTAKVLHLTTLNPHIRSALRSAGLSALADPVRVLEDA